MRMEHGEVMNEAGEGGEKRRKKEGGEGDEDGDETEVVDDDGKKKHKENKKMKMVTPSHSIPFLSFFSLSLSSLLSLFHFYILPLSFSVSYLRYHAFPFSSLSFRSIPSIFPSYLFPPHHSLLSSLSCLPFIFTPVPFHSFYFSYLSFSSLSHCLLSFLSPLHFAFISLPYHSQQSLHLHLSLQSPQHFLSSPPHSFFFFFPLTLLPHIHFSSSTLHTIH